jgi:hypothetical protein
MNLRPFVKGVNSPCLNSTWHKKQPVQRVADHDMNAAIHMDGIRWQVEPRKRINNMQRMARKDVPTILGDAITRFMSIDGGKVKRLV